MVIWSLRPALRTGEQRIYIAFYATGRGAMDVPRFDGEFSARPWATLWLPSPYKSAEWMPT